MTKRLQTNRTVIDEDNLCEILYHILWDKNIYSPSSALPVFIPDTVCFRAGVPVAWYFSDQEGVMKRKLEANLTLENVIDTFIRKKSKYGIVAYYLYLSDPPNKLANSTLKPLSYSNIQTIASDHPDEKTVIEYFDEESFRELLSNPFQLKKGVLQRFIDPQGDKNSIELY